MPQVWESKKWLVRFVFPVTRFVSMSAIFFQAVKVSKSSLLIPIGSWMRYSVIHRSVIVNLLPKGLNWKRCFPIMYLNYHVKG